MLHEQNPGLVSTTSGPLATGKDTVPALPLPNLPRGLDTETAAYFSKLVDEKIDNALRAYSSKSEEEVASENRRNLRNNILYGVGGLIVGVGGAYLWRKWRGTDEDGDNDMDMANE